MIKIMEDSRPVISIWLGENINYVVSSKTGVTKIEPYQETGENAYVNWFAICKGDIIVTRINAQFVSEINYV